MKHVTKSRRMMWSGHTSCERETRNLHRVLGRKPEGKRLLWRPSGRCVGTDRINLGQNMHKWQAGGNMEMNTLWTRPVTSLPHLTLIFLDSSVSTWQASNCNMWQQASQSSPPGYRHLTKIQASLSQCQWRQCRSLVCTICYTCAMYTMISWYSSWQVCYLISGISLCKNTTETSDKDKLQTAK
jgi:hypothetical protein